MTVETLTRAEFARDVGYADRDGNPSELSHIFYGTRWAGGDSARGGRC